jgi:hypothetical protein
VERGFSPGKLRLTFTAKAFRTGKGKSGLCFAIFKMAIMGLVEKNIPRQDKKGLTALFLPYPLFL